MRGGFTLIEVVIAVSIAAALTGGIYAALVSTSHAAESQAFDAKRERAKAKAVEILRADFRGRLKLKLEAAGQGLEAETRISLESTAEGLSPDGLRRALPSIRYIASTAGLKREEGPIRVTLLDTPARFEFWEGSLWKLAPSKEGSAIRALLGDPAEAVVIR